MSKRNTILAFVAAGLLALTAVAVPVAAEEGHDDQDDSESQSRSGSHREAAKQDAERRREAAKQEMEERREAAKDWKEACRDELDGDNATGNATLNETQQRRCMAVKEYGDHAFKARRESHALLGAIAAIERRIGRLEVKEIQLQAELDSGNFTGNHTAESLQEDIAKIQEHQERMAERLAHLEERLAALHAKWTAVRDHVESRRHGQDDDEEEDEDESESESESDSSSSSSQSESSSSSSPPA